MHVMPAFNLMQVSAPDLRWSRGARSGGDNEIRAERKIGTENVDVGTCGAAYVSDHLLPVPLQIDTADLVHSRIEVGKVHSLTRGIPRRGEQIPIDIEQNPRLSAIRAHQPQMRLLVKQPLVLKTQMSNPPAIR